MTETFKPRAPRAHDNGRVSEATIPLLINSTLITFAKLCHKMRLVLHTLEYSAQNEVVSIIISTKTCLTNNQ